METEAPVEATWPQEQGRAFTLSVPVISVSTWGYHRGAVSIPQINSPCVALRGCQAGSRSETTNLWGLGVFCAPPFPSLKAPPSPRNPWGSLPTSFRSFRSLFQVHPHQSPSCGIVHVISYRCTAFPCVCVSPHGLGYCLT